MKSTPCPITSRPPTRHTRHDWHTWAARRKRSAPALLLLAAVLALAPPAGAQFLERKWARFHNLTVNLDVTAAYACALALDDTGGAVLAIARFQPYSGSLSPELRRYSVEGTLLWQQKPPLDVGAVAVAGNRVIAARQARQASSPGGPNLICYDLADGTILWEQYERPEPAQSNLIAVDDAGHIIVVGDTPYGSNPRRTTVSKYDAATGGLVWEMPYVESYINISFAWAKGMAVDRAGNVIVTGSGGSDYYTAKYAAADGAVVWEKRYNGSAQSVDEPSAVAVDDAGHVIVTGLSLESRSNPPAIYTAKYAAEDGALLWEQRQDEGRWDHNIALAVEAGGDVLVAGYTSSSRLLVLKYAGADGEVRWERRSDDQDWYAADETETPLAMALDGEGNPVVTGIQRYDYTTMKYSGADGRVLWSQTLGGGYHDEFSAGPLLAITARGEPVIAGGTNLPANGAAFHAHAYRLAAEDGAVAWEEKLDLPYIHLNSAATGVAMDNDGHIALLEDRAWPSSPHIAMYARDGTRLWKRNSYPYSGLGRAVASFDGAGHMVVMGYGCSGPLDRDDSTHIHFHTAKYDSDTGELLWQTTFQGPLNNDGYASDDIPRAMAVDGAGDVIVTGSSTGLNGGYTVKYASGDGTVLWSHGGPEHPAGNCVAVDGAGNVLIGVSGDFLLSKYTSADGTLVWRRSRKNAVVTSLHVDAAGRATVVGGMSATINGQFTNYYAAKFAADGTQLWEHTSPLPEKTWEAVNSLTVDDQGDVFVARLVRIGQTTTYVTVKHAAADGTPLWEQRHDGHANWHNHPPSIVLDAHGRVLVAGTVLNAAGNTDVFLVAYATVDGSVRDEWTFDGADHGDDSLAFYGMAAGPNGLIALAGSSASLATGTMEPMLLLYGPPGTAPDPAFAAWGKTHGLLGDAAGFTADPDRDGVPNGLEFAFGLDPTVARPAGLPPGVGVAGLPSVRLSSPVVNRRLKVEYVRRRDAAVRYVVEFSSGLDAAWTAATGPPAAVMLIDDDRERVTVIDAVPLEAASQRFGRVRVVLP